VGEPSHEVQTAQPGRLRTYLGTAPGVGKTYAMLNDGRRRSEGGEQVVVGWIEHHGRTETGAQLRDLEIVPSRSVDHRGGRFEELDVAAIIARHPDVVLIDELAHTNTEGAGKRWEDTAELLAAGVSVVTTVNVANLLSLRDYAAQVTGAGTVESVPDEFVRSGEVVLVDLAPEALRRRIAVGRVYSADRVGGALANYFRTPNLAALSELGRAWMAGSVDSIAGAVLARQGVGPLAPRPMVLAGVSGSDWGENVIRRAAVLAAEDDADLLVVHVNVGEGLGRRRAGTLERYRDTTLDAGGRYAELDGTSAADTLADTARDGHATRVVIARHRSWLGELVRGSVASRIRRLVPGIPVDEVRPGT
jgi:two-component system sensor histidine kinase KdpD